MNPAPRQAPAPAAFPAQVHDLLLLRDDARPQWEDAACAAWALPALRQTPWVVVRRAAPRRDCLAVGVRGALRAQRAAAWVDTAAVRRVLRPADLLRLDAQLPAGRATLPAFDALRLLTLSWRIGDGPHDWGPAGSVGFELASRRPTATAHSDLDIVVRCACAPPPARAGRWLQALPQSAPARIDVRLEWPEGGAALAEYAAGGDYLLRQAQGGVLLRQRCREPEAA